MPEAHRIPVQRTKVQPQPGRIAVTVGFNQEAPTVKGYKCRWVNKNGRKGTAEYIYVKEV